MFLIKFHFAFEAVKVEAKWGRKLTPRSLEGNPNEIRTKGMTYELLAALLFFIVLFVFSGEIYMKVFGERSCSVVPWVFLFIR